MNDMISGLAGQIFQKLAENPAAKMQPTPQGGRSFESYMQQDGKTTVGGVDQSPKIEQPKTSGVEMQDKLAELEKSLSDRFRESDRKQTDFNKLMPDLTDSKTRLSMLREAYSKIGDTSKVTSDLGGRFVQVESEYKAVEEIMHSSKNLSTGELLALQARLYQVGQHIEVMSKVVDQMAGGIKTVLNTNV